MHKPFVFPVKSPPFLSIVNRHCCSNRDLRSLLHRLIRRREIQGSFNKIPNKIHLPPFSAISTYISQLNSKINSKKTLFMQNEEAPEGMSLYEVFYLYYFT